MNFKSHCQLKIFLFFIVLITHSALSKDDKVAFKPMIPKLTVADPLDVVSNFVRRERAQQEPMTIKILALRAQFVRDSLKTTTGDGHFDLSDESDYKIDGPPHNRTYFEHQLLALHNYFYTVSKGQLGLEYQVYPPAEDAAYQMPNDMVYYSGEEDEEKQKQRWAELLRDAIEAAKADNPGFANYDAFIIFHAGVGNDFDFDFNETPFDIQSAFIDFATLQETLGQNETNYRGIPAGDNFYIQEGIILPEQQSQKGIDLGLLGTATLLMGSQLGMPSLFNTQTGRPGIGMWGLMDQGSFNFYGLIPAHPCAWMKLYMGWEEAVTVRTLDQAIIGTANTKSAPHLFKVPITASEYFLLENRQEDWNGDGMTFGRDEYGKRAQFDSLGTIAIEEGLRVITRVDEYDYGLPGSGILVWHIDENVIRDNLQSNTINDDPAHRGVDLVECDGPQDIGQQYAMFTPGYGTESGDYWDPFWDGNISHKYINDERPVSLTPYSIPTSNAHGRAVTHIEFTNFSGKDTLMTCRIGNTWHQPGFPQYTGQKFGEGTLNWIRLENNKNAVVAVALNGDIYGWTQDGSKIIDNDHTAHVTDYSGKTTVYPLALLASVGDSVFLPPVNMGFVDDDDNMDFAIVDKSGVMTIWSPADKDGDGQADLLQRLDLGERITSLPTPYGIGTESGYFYKLSAGEDGEFENLQKIKISDEPLFGVHQWTFVSETGTLTNLHVFTTVHGNVYAYDKDFQMIWQSKAFGGGTKFYPLSVTAFGDEKAQNPDPFTPLIIVSNDGQITFLDSEGHIVRKGISITPGEIKSAPGLGDVDGDGMPELLLSSESALYAFEINTGVSTLNFPLPVDNAATRSFLSSPLCFSNSSKNESFTFAATTGGFVLCFDAHGKLSADFPLSAGAPVTSSPLLLEKDAGSDEALLFVLADDGFLYAWNIDYATPAGGWQRFGGGYENNFNVHQYQDSETVVSADIMPKKRVFCYPNPAENGRTIIRYTLNEHVDHVSIRIYDIAGELVVQLNDGGVSQGDHEVEWDVSSIQSGAYIARVEAQAKSGHVVEFIKIAVVK
ncbi:T9SS C-terminal target domain-containing protein [candidate division KSB1 bacterium]|nr:T9SS type A sorting domain-containing protein [candidate division KSB1 bacterium]RQW00419.1 MAG: T9SS C-terminal target domain-containing protein [candidate division KSB1 bacterium]